MLRQLGTFHRLVSDWEVSLFTEPCLSPPTLIGLCCQLKSWLPCLRNMLSFINFMKIVQDGQESGSLSFDVYQRKYLENRILQELMHGLSFLELNDLSHDIIDIVQKNHANALGKVSVQKNLTLNLRMTTNPQLRGMFTHAFNSCTSHRLDEFLHSIWSGVLHKRISEDTARQESALNALAQSQLEDAMPVEEKERIHRFRDTLIGFQTTSSSNLSSTTLKKVKVSVSSTEIARQSSVVEAPYFLRRVAYAAIRSGTDLALVNKFAHLNKSRERSITSR